MRSGIIIAIFLGLGTITAQASAEDDAALAEAKLQFRAGVNLLDDPDGAKYEEAFHAFKKAHALSHSPKVLGNIGFCAMHLERDGEAIEAYSAYLRDATDIDDRERQQIQRDLATMGSTAAKIHIVVRRPGTTFALVDTRLQTRGPAIENSYEMTNGEAIVRIRPGRHVFKVRVDELDALPLETTIEPASDTTHEIQFPKPKPVAPVVVREAPSRAGPVVLGAIGVVAIGTGVVTGIVARNTSQNIDSSCPNSECRSDYDLGSMRTKAKTFGTVADVSFIGGGALLGGAALWWILSPRTARAGSASAMCTPAGCGFTFQRGF